MKIVPVLLEYDYGIKERGISLEKKGFLPALEAIAEEVVPFWLEENGLYKDKAELQKKILNFVDCERPDIVFFILMRDEVQIDTIKELSKKYITINWFCDDDWRFDNFTKYVAPELTYSITTDKYSLIKYKTIDYKNVILSRWGSFEYEKNIDFNKIDYKYDVSFIGGKNPTREWYINSLKKKGIKVETFGSGWDNGRVSYDKMKDIFKTSRINLNLSNSVPTDYRFILSNLRKIKYVIKSEKRSEQIKARNFEIPCLGGFQLTNYVCGLEDHFQIGNEVATYTGIDDLYKQVQYYLENEDMRSVIAKAGNFKAQDYTYNENIRRVFEQVK